MATARIALRPAVRSNFFSLVRGHPNWIFWGLALIILGGCATNAALGHWANQPNRDLYQHMAAVRSLFVDIQNPQNPYVATAEGSRHFHPYWVAMAYLARSLGWNLQQVFAVASYLTMAIMACGFWMFGRAYFRSDWGPVALLLAATLAWSLPISHTGFINQPTLVEGASYPAQLLNGLSLVLWALVIGCLTRPKLALIIAPLIALMFATHQLGAGLALLVAVPIALLWPEGSGRARLLILIAIASGLLLSTAWPYYNPFDLILRAGNPTWRNGVEWYTPRYLFALLVPSAIGIVGLLKPVVPGTGRPLIAVLPVLVLGFVAGAFGFLTGTRFAPTAILVLQTGIAAILVRFVEAPERHSDRFKLALAGTAFGLVQFQVMMMGIHYYPKEYRQERRYGSVYASALALTGDVRDRQEIAAYHVAAWPISATGQKVLSVPWPEPMISDLAERQQKIDRLFDTRIPRSQRVALARSYGVRTLILDVRFGPSDDRWRLRDIWILREQSVLVRKAGSLMRLDLY